MNHIKAIALGSLVAGSLIISTVPAMAREHPYRQEHHFRWANAHHERHDFRRGHRDFRGDRRAFHKNRRDERREFHDRH
jgi:hypothetical protein